MGETMKSRSRVACLSAAVAALFWGGGNAQARDLTWDSNGTDAPLGADGPGVWDETAPNWVDAGANVTWSSAIPDSATFGNATSATVTGVGPHNVTLGAPITVQNLNIGTAADGGVYVIHDNFGAGSLTIAGNVSKIAPNGGPQIVMFAPGNTINLTAGAHTFAINDTSGDAAPEMAINGELSGAGGVTLNNGTFQTWGTLAFNVNNSYTGATNIDKGRLVITTSGGLGSAATGTTIGALGTLSFGGAGTTVPGGALNILEPITVTRGVYSGPDHTYPAAIISANGSGTHTLSGPLVIDSADARIAANTSTLILPGGNISLGANGAAGVLSFTGDFAGFIELQGSNPALATNGIKLVNAVEVKVASHDALGGASAPITFGENGNGSATLHVMNGFMTDFGTHAVNYASFSGGLNIPTGQTFTISQNLGTAGSNQGTLGKRGEGTLNLSGTNNLTGGQTFFDAGIVNITGGTTLDNLHLRSPTVNISTGGVVTLVEGFSSLGQDSTGTNGGPDKAIVNITGTGQLISQPNIDFNLSDNANTEGTINLQDNGVLTVGGLMHVAKSVGGKGTINQSGGTFNLTRDGNFTLVLGSRDGTGIYNLSGGTMNSEGEFYVGQGRNNLTATGTGTFNMTGGTVNLDHWFVIGREGGSGVVDISGGIFNKTRGGTHTEIDVFGGNGPSTMTIRGTGEYRAQAGDFRVGVGNHATAGPGNGTLNVQDSGQLVISAGEFWVGQGGATGVVNLEDSGLISVNNWIAIGRGGGTGTFNMSGGTFTKTGGGNFIVAAGGGSNGTLNQTGGTLNNTTGSEFWINEGAANGVYNLSGGTANLQRLDVGRNGGGTATFNLSGTGAMNATIVRLGESGSVSGTVNLDGGTLTATQVVDGASSGASTFNFNGGTLRAAGDHTQFMEGLTAANIQNGGAVLDSNGFSVTIAQPLVGGASTGGLTKTGAGTVALSAPANVYSGATTVSAGTLVVADVGSANRVLKGGALSIAPAARLDLKNNKLITTSPVGTATAGVYNGVQGEVQRARNGGAWDQPGLTTSMPDATTGLTTIGVATGAQIRNLGPTQTDLFAGQTINGNSTIAMYTYGGDANLDGAVTCDYYSQIDFNIAIPGAAGYYNGDFNYDGIISGDDYSVIDFNIAAQGAPFPTSGSSELSGVTADFGELSRAVPEPASACGLALLAGGLLARRRRRQGAN